MLQVKPITKEKADEFERVSKSFIGEANSLTNEAFEDKDTIENNEDIDRYDLLRVIKGEGVKYPIGDQVVTIRPLKVKQLYLLFKLTDGIKDDPEKRLRDSIAVFAEILKVDVEFLEENLEQDDIVDITELITYAVGKGKNLLKKKTHSVSMTEVRKFLVGKKKAGSTTRT